jgi:CubicO group peptidase (beta-lactamase class C family)
MTTPTWSKAGLERLNDVLSGHVESGATPGLAWLVSRGGEVHAGVLGTLGREGTPAMGRDSIFRISSTTKPVTAVAAMLLVEECKLRLDEPVDRLLPELADRRVLADPDGPLDDTVPAERPVTVRDLLTFRLGLGLDLTRFDRQKVVAELGERGLPPGPPAPGHTPGPDEFMRILGSVPLEWQPGERWLYHTSAAVLGVLIARAAEQPFEQFLAERLFEPLGMVDTGFHVPADKIGRFGWCLAVDFATGEPDTYDEPDEQWASPPAFAGGGDGLVSTVDDMRTFAEMLLAGGVHQGQRILSRPSIEAMTTNQLTPDQLSSSSPGNDSSLGWGLGIGVRVQRTGIAHSVGTYGWDGGLGSTWHNDPAEGLIGILLTNHAWSSPQPPQVFDDFWTSTYAAIDD